MAPPNTTIWKIDEHTKAKHVLLKKYLQAWFPILARYNGKIIYLDGFCGPGRYTGGEPGSPIVALETALDQRDIGQKEYGFYFVDEFQDRVENLNSEISKLALPANFKVTTKCAKFDEELTRILNDLKARSVSLAPTFAFIDPFGFSGIPFSLIRSLMSYQGCEVLINLNVAGIQRFLESPDEKVVAHILETLGAEVGSDVLNGEGDRLEKIKDFYQKQLQSCSKYVRYFLMRNRLGHAVYYLFFASNNPLGHAKFKEAMWQVDQSGDFVFSDATANQTVLFDGEPSVHNPSVINLLKEKFPRARKVTSEQAQRFIEDETGFTRKHMLCALNEMEDKKSISVSPLKIDGKKRNKRGFAPGTIMDFMENA